VEAAVSGGGMVLKKLILTVITMGVILLTTVSTVLATNPFPTPSGTGIHWSFAGNPDGCATCHSTHTSSYDKLMKTNYTETQVCYQCHNGTGGNNVETGMDGSYPSPAGPFELLVPQGSKTVTSAHRVGNSYTYVPGGIDPSGNPLATSLAPFNFECGSCHNPHGSTNWHLVRDNINGFSVSFYSNYDAQVGVKYGYGASSLCSACHQGYYNNTGTTQNPNSTGGTITYSHRVDFDPAPYTAPAGPYDPAGTTTDFYYVGVTQQVPLQKAQDGTTLMTCMTCHFAHGSKVLPSDTFASSVTSGPTSSLLRNDNRGVCAQCHPGNTFY